MHAEFVFVDPEGYYMSFFRVYLHAGYEEKSEFPAQMFQRLPAPEPVVLGKAETVKAGFFRVLGNFQYTTWSI